jgi:hypothetical protein
MISWTYKGIDIAKRRPETYGFVYLNTYSDGTMYIGKKNFFSITTKKPLMNGTNRDGGKFFNKIVNHKVKQMEMVISENDWRDYNGSSKKTKALTLIKKEILQVYIDSINLTLGEYEWMIKLDVLRSDMYHNDNIGGKFFKGRIKKELTEGF